MKEVRFESVLKQVGADIARYERKQRIVAANHIKAAIKTKARAVRVRGNLEKGVYARNEQDVSFVGIRAPGYQNYLVEFGHYLGKKGTAARKFVPPHPIVYPTFEEQSQAVIAIMSQAVPV